MSAALWTSEDAATATGSRTGTWSANRVVIDSRAVQQGDLFVALKGERFDGHAFVPDALKSGAAAAMVGAPSLGDSTLLPPLAGVRRGEGEPQSSVSVKHSPLNPPAGGGNKLAACPADKLLVVPDTLQGLTALGRAGRARTKARVIGLTGSVGKTSAKEMLRLALSTHGNTFASHGNFNNHIGTPLNLANMPLDAEFAVLEMGMNHAGEIAALTRLVRPEIAIITNVEAVHLEFFESLAAIADAKAEIFEGLTQGGTAILNRDNPYFTRCAEAAKRHGASRILSFGMDAGADLRLLDSAIEAGGMRIRASVAGTPVEFALGALGEHWAQPALIALGVAYALGLDIAKTAAALSGFREPGGRGNLQPIHVAGSTATLIDDSYNASPASMRAAIAKLGALAAHQPSYTRKIAILGDMRELGSSAPALHAELAPALVEAGVDRVLAAGPLMLNLYHAIPATMRGAHADSAEALLHDVQEMLQPGDLVLVKGSHGSKMYEIAEALVNNNATEGKKKYAP